MSRGAILTNAEVMKLRGAPASSRVGDNNLVDRAVTLGAVRDGAVAGKLDCVWAVKTLPAGYTPGELTIAHTLGRVPSLVSLWMQEGGGVAHCRATSRSVWSATAVRVTLALATGSLDNVTLTFLIGG